MELILTKDIDNLGFKDDLVTVKNGYGRNFLIPHGFAILATESAKKVLAENLRQRAHKEAKAVEDANKSAEVIRAMEIKMLAKVGSGNKLFGSVTNADLADEIAKKGVELDKRYIQIVGGSVKVLGNYEAKIRLHREVNVEINFEVAAQPKK